MIPAQLIRALGQAAKLCGRAEIHARLVGLEDEATLDDVLELLDELVDAVDRQRPASPPEDKPQDGRGLARGEHSAEILRLVGEGLRDREIAQRLGVGVDLVRGVRRRAGVAAAPWTPPAEARSGWQERLRELHGEELLVAEIAERTGWTIRTVQQRLHALGLRAHRPHTRSPREER